VGAAREWWQDRAVARKGQNDPVLITDAREDPETELRRREIRYVAMLVTRALCLIGAAVLVAQRPWLWQLWAVLCVMGAVVLPWLAVILANDRPPLRRGPTPSGPPAGSAAQPVLEQREYKVIDPD
jgi:hypothetical protein